MSESSSIEWTDTTWNPVRGCTKVSPGCAHCYAETFSERFRGVKGHAFEQGFDLRLVPEKLDAPLSWKKPRRVFVNSMSDLFQSGVEWAFVERVFETMQATPQHTYQVLTKRALEMKLFADHWAYHHGGPLANVWLGVSVENQHFADERIPLLLKTPAAVRFLSCEPLLEGLDLGKHRPGALGLHWVIVGGESGHGARPCKTWWIENIVGQCRDAGIAVFVKQLGGKPIETFNHVEDHDMHLNDRKGGDMSEWPEDLRVREFPSPRTARPAR